MSGEPVPGSLEDILGVWDAQGPFPLRDKGDVALLVNEIKRLRARIDGSGAVEADRVMSGYIVDTVFGWVLIDGHDNATCDGCAEEKSLRYEWPDTSAWLCEDCWQDATETDRLRAEVDRLRAELDLLEELVENAVAQGCSDGDRFDSCAISTWADGIRWLAARGVLVIESDHGRRVIARRAAHPVEADR